MQYLARFALFVCLCVASQAMDLSGSVAGATAVTLTLSGKASRTTTSGTNGAYSFTGLVAGSYTIKPTKYGYKFSPASRTVTIGTTSITGLNFNASPNRFSIYGTVTGTTAVAVKLTGNNVSLSTTTATNGTYRFTSLLEGAYTVTPVKSGFTFTPASRTVSSVSVSIKDVNFVGTATTTTPPPPAHSVTLSWNPSTSSSISGYRVYRAATSGGAYSKVADVTSTSYLDKSVVAGATYFYVTTAYNVDGESVHSNEVQAVIPTP